MGLLSPHGAEPSWFHLYGSSSHRQHKNRKHRATEGLDFNLCLGAHDLHNLTSLILLIYEIIGLNPVSSKIPFNIRACSLSEYPVFRNDKSS